MRFSFLLFKKYDKLIYDIRWYVVTDNEICVWWPKLKRIIKVRALRDQYQKHQYLFGLISADVLYWLIYSSQGKKKADWFLWCSGNNGDKEYELITAVVIITAMTAIIVITKIIIRIIVVVLSIAILIATTEVFINVLKIITELLECQGL